jgi:hypothetical protein
MCFSTQEKIQGKNSCRSGPNIPYALFINNFLKLSILFFGQSNHQNGFSGSPQHPPRRASHHGVR